MTYAQYANSLFLLQSNLPLMCIETSRACECQYTIAHALTQPDVFVGAECPTTVQNLHAVLG